MGKRLERFGEVRIIDETNGFGLEKLGKTFTYGIFLLPLIVPPALSLSHSFTLLLVVKLT